MAEPLTPALQKKLNEYHKALESEFGAAEAGALEGEDFEALVRATFKEHTPTACARIVWLAANAESEAVQLRAAQTILCEAFKIALAESDPFKKLMEQLTSNDTNAAPAPSAESTS